MTDRLAALLLPLLNEVVETDSRDGSVDTEAGSLFIAARLAAAGVTVAPALDVEALARAMRQHAEHHTGPVEIECAAAVATIYAEEVTRE